MVKVNKMIIISLNVPKLYGSFMNLGIVIFVFIGLTNYKWIEWLELGLWMLIFDVCFRFLNHLVMYLRSRYIQSKA